MYRVFPAVLLVLLVAGCTSTPIDFTQASASSRYCDRYFIYRMCAQDLSGDGQVDVMYFEDNNEIFMYRPESTEALKSKLVLHPCVQVMDDGMTRAANQLLLIDSDTGFFKKADIKTDLIGQYMHYASRINKCNKQEDNTNVAATEVNDEFGDFALEELK